MQCASVELTRVPAQIQAGDRYVIRIRSRNHPASAGWQLRLSVAGVSSGYWLSVADGDDHLFTLSAQETGQLVAGTYQWLLRATKLPDVETLDAGMLVVLADIAQLAPGDGVLWLEQVVQVLRASITGSLTGGVASYMIGSRQVQEIPIQQRARLLAQYEARLAAERGYGGFGQPVRMTATGFTS